MHVKSLAAKLYCLLKEIHSHIHTHLVNNRLTEYKRTECVMWKTKGKRMMTTTATRIETMEIDYTQFKAKGKRNTIIMNEKRMFLSSFASSASADSFSSTSFLLFFSFLLSFSPSLFVFTLRILNSLHKYRSDGNRHSSIYIILYLYMLTNSYKFTL